MAPPYPQRWRALDADALGDLRLALKVCKGSPTDAARILGLAGVSTLWRVAYAVPEVLAIIREGSKGPGRKRVA